MSSGPPSTCRQVSWTRAPPSPDFSTSLITSPEQRSRSLPRDLLMDLTRRAGGLFAGGVEFRRRRGRGGGRGAAADPRVLRGRKRKGSG